MSTLLQPARFAVAFSPLSIGWHTAFWTEGPELVALALANGAAVGTWPDEASTHDATQATGSKQPLYRASVAAFNNKPVIEGDAVDDFMATASFTALTAPNTIVSIGTTPAVDNYLYDGVATGNRNYFKRSATGNEQGTSTNDIHGGSIDASPHLRIATYNGASSTLEIDGASVLSGSLTNASLTGLTLLTYFGAIGQFGRYMAFIGLLNGTLTAQQKADLHTWCQTHYGLA